MWEIYINKVTLSTSLKIQLDADQILKDVRAIDVIMDSSIFHIVYHAVVALKEPKKKYVINKMKLASVKKMFRAPHVIVVWMVHTIYKVQIPKVVQNVTVPVRRLVVNAPI